MTKLLFFAFMLITLYLSAGGRWPLSGEDRFVQIVWLAQIALFCGGVALLDWIINRSGVQRCDD